MDLQRELHVLLRETGPGQMFNTAYDTAWVARLAEIGEPIGFQALEWLREHQLSDGSWGASVPHYFHDRLVSTLAAVTALVRHGKAEDHRRVQRALLGVDSAIKGLPTDLVGETIGFEMIVPALLAEAMALGAVHRRESNLFQVAMDDSLFAMPGEKQNTSRRRRRADDYLERMAVQRMTKLQMLPKGKVSRHVTVAFSAEMAGSDNLNLFDIDHLQESNGSVGHSPSATAYFALYVRPNDPAAFDYLHRVAALSSNDGGFPDVAPFDVFEPAWVLWNLALAAPPLDEESQALCQIRLDFLENAWVPNRGVGFAAEYTPKDGDETALAFDVLTRYGRSASADTLLTYEASEHFRCYSIESTPSISANVHLLGAFRVGGFEVHHPAPQKIINFLRRKCLLEMFWLDKWHSSPYYPTAHAIIAAAGYADDLAARPVDWLIDTQNRDGSWGYYLPTAEETAYALQALFAWKRTGKTVPKGILKRGLNWLLEHKEDSYQPLWVGKCLYCPILVVRSAILSALWMGAQEDII